MCSEGCSKESRGSIDLCQHGMNMHIDSFIHDLHCGTHCISWVILFYILINNTIGYLGFFITTKGS